MGPHVAFGIATVVTVGRLVAYTVSDRDRWRRFVFLLLLTLAVAAGWWLLVDSGVHVLMYEFGPASIIHPR